MPGIDPVRFFEELTTELRRRGVMCGITSGLACVHYGVAETTKDCDLLCHEGSYAELLEILQELKPDRVSCKYRGNLSPPLDARWHAGGWTSHFEWDAEPDPLLLDVFAHAIRESSPWPAELAGLYAGPNTVAEMKRTNRDKDWPFITALGVRMIEAGDERGWLHIFSLDVLKEFLEAGSCPACLIAQRPALRMAAEGDDKAAGALNAERKLWEELDRRRVHILEHRLRPYVSAVRRGRTESVEANFQEDHAFRIRCALEHLPQNPIREYGLERYIAESMDVLVKNGIIPETALSWLPDVRAYFAWL